MDDRLLDVERKIDRLCHMMETHVQRFDEHAESVGEWKSRLGNTLYGLNGSPGLLVRLDRLEQSQERQRWFVRAVAGAVIVLLVGAAWMALRQ